MHGKYEYISTEEVMAGVKIRLALDTNDFDIELKYYINEGAIHLNNTQTFVPKKTDIVFIDGQAYVPDGYQSFLGLYFPGNQVYYAQKIYYNTPDYSGLTVIDSKGSVDVLQGVLDVGASVTATGTLWYIGENTNDEGWFMVTPRAERGLVAYACGNFKNERPAIYGNGAGDKQLKLYAAQKAWLNGELRKEEAHEDVLALRAIMNARSIDAINGYLGSIYNNM